MAVHLVSTLRIPVAEVISHLWSDAVAAVAGLWRAIVDGTSGVWRAVIAAIGAICRDIVDPAITAAGRGIEWLRAHRGPPGGPRPP